jgi:predicted DCC family thiol-disulfide oxidoreductase YuxK
VEFAVESLTNPIVLYDGVCGLCNGFVQFLLKRDKNHRLKFASLQSSFAQQVLTRHSVNPDRLDTVYVVLDHDNPQERLLSRSDAVLYLASELQGFWRVFLAGRVVPRFLRDFFYEVVARNRYRVFGKYDSCMMPEPGYRDKFVDLN